MKGTFFNQPLEWNIETSGESWKQGGTISGLLKVKNHGNESIPLKSSGVALSFADIKKVQSRAEDAFKHYAQLEFNQDEIRPQSTAELNFSFSLDPNCPVSDKKSSHYISFGKKFSESHLQVKIDPQLLFTKIIGLLDTFYRFKLKEYKTNKKGVEFKLIPPSSREMANIDSLLLTFIMDGNDLFMSFNFQVKKLDTTGISTKVNKESVVIEKKLAPRQYSLGKEYLNQDEIQKCVEEILGQVKLKAIF